MLTDTIVRYSKSKYKDYTLKDTKGLFLFISHVGGKSWHFRFALSGRERRISIGTYPELSLKDARQMRDEMRSLVAKGVDPKVRLKQDKTRLNFAAAFERWLTFRALTLKRGRQSTLSQIERIFAKDLLPSLGQIALFDITRADVLSAVRQIEQRGALSIAKKCRTWLSQLFRYAMVEMELTVNPAADMDIVAIPQKPVKHNPFLRIHELPGFLRDLRHYQGSEQTLLGIWLLLLTGVRTGELRFATPDQLDLERGLWMIPPERVKQLKRQVEAGREVEAYVVPLSRQAIEVFIYLLELMEPNQRYLLAHRSRLFEPVSENTLNGALKRMRYQGRLTGHGIRATISTTLNELNYPKEWIESQLSHVDKDQVRAAYNHASYVDQRRQMMQDWADRLDRWEKEGIAVKPLTVVPLPASKVIAPDKQHQSIGSIITRKEQRPQPILTAIQKKQADRLQEYEASHNLPVSTFAKLMGKSRDQINREIQARQLLTINIGNRGQRIPDWQLNPLCQQFIEQLLTSTSDIDNWLLYQAVSADYEGVGVPVNILSKTNLSQITEMVLAHIRTC